MEEEMNRTAELVAFMVQADMVHFDADKEIHEIEDKIVALEAQSANVHDESNAQKVGAKGAASVPEESSGSRVRTERAAWERVAEAMLKGPRIRKRKTKRWDQTGDENIEKGPEGCRRQSLMSAGPSRCSRGTCTMVRFGSSKERLKRWIGSAA